MNGQKGIDLYDSFGFVIDKEDGSDGMCYEGEESKKVQQQDLNDIESMFELVHNVDLLSEEWTLQYELILQTRKRRIGKLNKDLKGRLSQLRKEWQSSIDGYNEKKLKLHQQRNKIISMLLDAGDNEHIDELDGIDLALQFKLALDNPNRF